MKSGGDAASAADEELLLQLWRLQQAVASSRTAGGGAATDDTALLEVAQRLLLEAETQGAAGGALAWCATGRACEPARAPADPNAATDERLPRDVTVASETSSRAAELLTRELNERCALLTRQLDNERRRHSETAADLKESRAAVDAQKGAARAARTRAAQLSRGTAAHAPPPPRR